MRIGKHFGLSDKLLLAFVVASMIAVGAITLSWFNFQQVVNSQRKIIDNSIPALNTIQQLARVSTGIFTQAPQLGSASHLGEVNRLRHLFQTDISDMDQLLLKLKATRFEEDLRLTLKKLVRQIDDNLKLQIDSVVKRLLLNQQAQLSRREGQQAATDLIELSESLIANAMTGNVSILSSLYSVIEKHEVDVPEVFDSLDHLIEVGLDQMERLSALQVTCIRLKALLDLLSIENNPVTIDKNEKQYIALLAVIERRIRDIADPSRRKIAQLQFQILKTKAGNNGLFELRQKQLKRAIMFDQIRQQGLTLVSDLNQQATEMLKAGNRSIESSGIEAEQAASSGLVGYLMIASLLLLGLVACLWSMRRYHVLTRLRAMESAVQAITTGNYDVEIPTADSGGLSGLAHAIEELRDNARTRDELEQQLVSHQQHLEQLVTQRTDELQQSNALLAHEVDEHELARQDAEAANQAKTNFLANVSHELRTPVSGVLGMLQLLCDTKLGERQWEYIRMIRSANLTLLDTMDDMLGYSQLEAGKLNIELTSFSLRDTIDNMLSLQAVRANAKGIALVREVDDDVPDYLIGDRRKMNQILLNLVGNAVKFTEEGSVVVIVSAISHQDDLFALEFIVSDTGIGIDDKYLDEVLKPFFQVSDVSNRYHGGTGLGLAICKRLVEAMGGQLVITSLVNQGSEFKFTLTLECSNQPAITQTGQQDTLAGSAITQALTVLVVEDDDINRLVCLRYLESLGHRVIEASDGIQALALLQSCTESIDVILMDISLPGASGLEVAVEIRALPDQRWEQVPIIAMSAHAFSQAVDSYYAAGMALFLSKPFDKHQLDKALCQVTNKQSKNRQSNEVEPDESDPINHETLLLDEDYLEGELESLGVETLTELSVLFSQELSIFAEKFSASQRQSDWITLSKQTHRLKSAAGNLGFRQVIENAKKLEKSAALKSVQAEGIATLVTALLACCESSVSALDQWLFRHQH